MKTLWDVSDRRGLQERLATLAPDRPAQWGGMNAPRMVAHLVDSMRMTIGDLPTEMKSGPLRYPGLKHLIVYLLPWPKGTPTAPELLTRPPGDWSGDLAELQRLIDRFAARDRSAQFPLHPAFGRLSSRAWGVLAYRHIDHHLRQFNV